MQDWYQTREEGNLNHRGQAIPKGKKIRLTENQAKLHNLKSEKVAKCDPPKDPRESGVLAEYNQWELFEKKQTKAKERKVEGSK